MDKQQRLEAARRGGLNSARTRAERFRRIEEFRATLIQRTGAANDPIKLALIDLATTHYAAIVSKYSVSCLVFRARKRLNMLALSAIAGNLQNLLDRLGVGLEHERDSDASRKDYADRWQVYIRGEGPAPHDLEGK